MRIAVTGASGNVGSALLRLLVEQGTHEVVGIVRRPPREAGPPYDAVEWVAADLTLDRCEPALEEALAGADAVVHLAWGFQPSHRLDHLAELGIGGTRRVLRAVLAAGVPTLVHQSSVGAYSARVDATPVDESWPTDGLPRSPYSRHKAAAERLLDEVERDRPDLAVARTRPGIVGQSPAGSSLLRYGLPAVVPSGALRRLPVLPVDRRLSLPVVHADDVATALLACVESRARGAYNLAAEPPLTADLLAEVLGARHVHVPWAAVRAAAAGAWHARLQPVDPGWVELAAKAPLLDTTRARAELGWGPRVDAATTMRETVAGMAGQDAAPTPVLRRREVRGALVRGVRRGSVTRRREP